MERAVFYAVSSSHYINDISGHRSLLEGTQVVTTPFLALAPHVPRVVDIPYEAVALPCSDCTDCSDVSDQTDSTDVTDGGGIII